MSTLGDIKARAEKATGGPWTWAGTAARHVLSGCTGQVLACASLLYPNPQNEQFIAHARTDVPKLVAALEAVEAQVLLLESIQDGADSIGANVVAGSVAENIRYVIDEALS